MISNARGYYRYALTLAAGAAAVVSASSTIAGATTSARITAVKTSGTPANPEITVIGRGFGSRPAARPANFPTPTFKTGCPKVPVAKAGRTYGDLLYFTDLNAKKGTYKNWTAGQYDNQYQDCIGIVIDQWSKTKVRFHFGATYGKFFPGNTYFLSNGDRFKVFVRHATLVRKANLG